MTDVLLNAGRISLSNVNSQTWSVTISGFAIVFVVLAVLIVVFYVFGKIMTVVQGKSSEKQKSADNTASEPDEVTDEIAAVITAAVAESTGGKNFIIKQIKQSGGDE